MDKLIYKYYRVNEYLFDVLISNQLYFSSIDQFNDPYDCHFAVKGLPTIEDYRKFWEQHSDNVDDYRHHLETFEKSAEGAMKPLLKAIREFLAYYGICCFAESKEELLMWSHYANSHYGICIGFDFAQMTKSFPQFDKVEYKSEPHLFDITDMSSSMAKSILTKSKNWEYDVPH
jgi:hypothetical protein